MKKLRKITKPKCGLINFTLQCCVPEISNMLPLATLPIPI